VPFGYGIDPLQTLSHDAYLALRADATVLERDLHGDKVLQLADGSYLKLFRRKRLISSAAWYPYAQRFADNATELERRGIPCPKVVGAFRIADFSRDAVRYIPLAGRTLRQVIEAESVSPDLPEKMGRFVARLHESGIYFRSLHLGNIVLTPSGAMGLIDVADMRTQNRALDNNQRKRNLLRLRRDPPDCFWLSGERKNVFDSGYAVEHRENFDKAPNHGK
jgi:tRNA A-37 threonylcarbamoyl transferase component Bud32